MSATQSSFSARQNRLPIRVKCFVLYGVNTLWFILVYSGSANHRLKGVLISPQPDQLPDIVGRNRQCRWKEGLFMYRIPSFFLLQRLKGSMSEDARDFSNIETRTSTKFIFLQGKAPKKIHAILKDTLREHASSYATVKNWVAQFKRGDFSTCDAPCPGRGETQVEKSPR